MNKLGRWLFIAGLVIAVLAGLFLNFGWVTWVLAILGIVVGFMNVSGSETQGFLLAAVALMLSVSAVQNVPFVGGVVTTILGYVVTFVAGAMLVVALKALFESAKD